MVGVFLLSLFISYVAKIKVNDYLYTTILSNIQVLLLSYELIQS